MLISDLFIEQLGYETARAWGLSSSVVILSLRGCEGYRIGAQWFPGANIQSGDLESVLHECGADPASMKIAECELPTHADQGYTGILLASGQNRLR